MIRQLAGHVAHRLGRLVGRFPAVASVERPDRWLKLGGVIVVLALALMVYRWRSGGGYQTLSRDFTTVLRCVKCGHTFGRSLDVADAPPFPCSACGTKEAWFLKKCHGCGALFLPPLEGDPPRQPMIPTCPSCGSQATGAAPLKEAP